jgi:hypothetical protein
MKTVRDQQGATQAPRCTAVTKAREKAHRGQMIEKAVPYLNGDPRKPEETKQWRENT